MPEVYLNKHGRSAADIIQQINIKNAKILAFILILGFLIYHGLLHWRYGIDSCKWLLSDGRFKGNQDWQPYGCMMHHYSQTDTRRCLRYLAFWSQPSHFVYIGDSRIRQLYFEFLHHLESHDTSTTTIHPEKPHSDLSFTDEKLRLRVDFIWSPYISQSMIEDFLKWKEEDDPPNVVVAGNGIWSIKESNASTQALEEYTMNLTRLAQVINNLSDKKSHILWILQEPVNSEKLHISRRMITNDQIDLYNIAAKQVLTHKNIQLWSSARLVAQGSLDGSKDGLHLSSLATKFDIQILLNMYCNDHMNFNDGNCCSSAESYTTLQVVTFSIFGVW